MYDTFRNAIADIFNNPDFTQIVYLNGIQYKCLVSTVNNDVAFTEAGLVDMVNFTLDIQVTDQSRNNIPKQNDRVTFRGKQYKIAHVDTDSALCTFKLYLISNSKGK